MSLKDYWYIAAESHEIKNKPVAMTAMGEHMVLFRAEDGTIAALEDRCSHRNMALSTGKVFRWVPHNDFRTMAYEPIR
jgi:phenylpropionate dioxygenase-like ring-hydroxylating dioxygenase large terminal subunit